MNPNPTMDVAVTDLVTQEAQSWPDRAKALAVTTSAEYSSAAEMLLGIKALRRAVDDTFDPLKRAASEAHQKIVDAKRTAEKPLAEAEVVIKGAMIAFDREQQRLARLEEDRQREVARQAEVDRVLAEAAAKEAEGREFNDPGLVYEAAQMVNEAIERPVSVAVAPVMKATPKVAGIAMKKVWAFRIVKPELVPAQYRVIDESKIRGVVRSLGRAANIPGVEVYEEQSLSAGRTAGREAQFKSWGPK